MSPNPRPFVTETDLLRLQKLAAAAENSLPRPAGLGPLRRELERALVFEARHIPRQVVTMNSRVRVRNLNNGLESVYTLVYPAEADSKQGRLSVLSALGAGLLGYSRGERFTWALPDGLVPFEIVEVEFQPEAEGRWEL